MAREVGLGGADVLGLKFTQQNLITKMRNQLGQYQSVRAGKIKDAHQEMGLQVRDAQLDVLQKQIEGHRRGGVQRETHYLVESMKGEGYVLATKEGFVVNPDGYLDSSPAALYWRNLELGTSVHIGQQIAYFRSNGFKNTPSAYIRDTELIGYKGTHPSTKPEDKTERRLGVSEIVNPIPPYAYMETGIETWQTTISPLSVYQRNGIPAQAAGARGTP